MHGLDYVLITYMFKIAKRKNDLLFKFLWEGKGHKIKQSEMIADYGDGGQKMLDIMGFNKSLKITWIAINSSE